MAARRILQQEALIEKISLVCDEMSSWRFDPAVDDPWGYVAGYHALRHLFVKRIDLASLLDVKAGAYAVYGWMPTTLKRMGSDGSLQALGRLALSGKERSIDSIPSLLREAQKNSLQPLMSINSSVVGTSKFLHFAAPEKFPIWDSQVASVFQLGSQAMSNSLHYVEYAKAMLTFVQTRAERVPAHFASVLASGGAEEGMPVLRCLEFLLFHYAKKKKNNPA